MKLHMVYWLSCFAIGASLPIATFDFTSSPPTVTVTLPSPFTFPNAVLKSLPMAVNADMCLGYAFANTSDVKPLLFHGAEALNISHLGFQLDLSAELDAHCKQPAMPTPSTLVATLVVATAAPSQLESVVECNLDDQANERNVCTLHQHYDQALSHVAFDILVDILDDASGFCAALAGVSTGTVSLKLPLVNFAPQSIQAAVASSSLDISSWSNLGVASRSPIPLIVPPSTAQFSLCSPSLISMDGDFAMSQAVGPFNFQSAHGSFNVGSHESLPDRLAINASLKLMVSPIPLVLPWDPTPLTITYNSNSSSTSLLLPLPLSYLDAAATANLTCSFEYFGQYNPANGGRCTLRLPFLADSTYWTLSAACQKQPQNIPWKQSLARQ